MVAAGFLVTTSLLVLVFIAATIGYGFYYNRIPGYFPVPHTAPRKWLLSVCIVPGRQQEFLNLLQYGALHVPFLTAIVVVVAREYPLKGTRFSDKDINDFRQQLRDLKPKLLPNARGTPYEAYYIHDEPERAPPVHLHVMDVNDGSNCKLLGACEWLQKQRVAQKTRAGEWGLMWCDDDVLYSPTIFARVADAFEQGDGCVAISGGSYRRAFLSKRDERVQRGLSKKAKDSCSSVTLPVSKKQAPMVDFFLGCSVCAGPLAWPTYASRKRAAAHQAREFAQQLQRLVTSNAHCQLADDVVFAWLYASKDVPICSLKSINAPHTTLFPCNNVQSADIKFDRNEMAINKVNGIHNTGGGHGARYPACNNACYRVINDS